jgi:1-aminocyclopropane-1-carboxylate deaminase
LFDFSPHYLSHYARGVSHQRLVWPALARKKISVYLRRDDVASAHYPGNKFYKLFYNIRAVLASGHKTVVSFGGAYSNHIHALAAMGQQYGLSTVGIIRGHSPQVLSPTLQDAQACGMQLLFLDKQSYQEKNIASLKDDLLKEYGTYYLLPEGGENREGVLGCGAIGEAIQANFSGDYTVCCAVGTGTTLAGVISGLPAHTPCIGFSVLKGEDRLSDHVRQWLSAVECEHTQWQIVTNFHHGGYAKTNPALLHFMQNLERANQLLLEPVYSAKMLWGIEQLALQDFWPEGSTVVAVHGGGIQGRRGFGLRNTL